MELRVVLFSAVAARTVVIRGECFLYRREGFDYACTGGWASDEREYGESGERGGKAQVAYRLASAWSLDANYSYLHMDNPVLASPEHKLYAGAAFSKGRWYVSTGCQYVAGLYTEVKVAGQGDYATEDFVLWNLRGSFRALEWLNIWVRGENLLARKYEINARFPMPKATVMAGMNVRF